MAIVTLLTDFGLSDPYVAEMKGVIRSIAPNVEIIDISHGIEKHSIVMGSYILETAAPFFPDGSIHVAVVDPGVGGSRKPVVIACDKGILVGPDNGLLARAAHKLGFQNAYQIQNSQFTRTSVSPTFHGRDIFAYSGAKIAIGMDPSLAGPTLQRMVRLEIPDPEFSKDQVACRVLYIDSFGSVVTNISESNIERFRFREVTRVRIRSKGGGQFEGVTTNSYSEIPHGLFGLLLGSQGYLEIALKEENASGKLQVKPLDPLELLFR